MERKTNREKFNELPRNKKAEYIWDYYRWHIVGVFVAIFAIWQIYTIATKPPMPVYSTDIVIAGKIATEQEVLDQTIARYNTEFDANIQCMPVNWDSMDQSMVATEQLFALKMMVRELDIMLIGQAKYDKFKLVENGDPVMALDTIPELKEILKANEDKLMKSISKEDGQTHVFGIKLDALPNVEGVVLGEELILSLMNPPKNMETAVAMVQYLLEQK
ncbi:MAG: hypothetical protein ACRC1P_06230 [Cellulosilyticaceae bacterium]